jgi:hypothetical protein
LAVLVDRPGPELMGPWVNWCLVVRVRFRRRPRRLGRGRGLRAWPGSGSRGCGRRRPAGGPDRLEQKAAGTGPHGLRRVRRGRRWSRSVPEWSPRRLAPPPARVASCRVAWMPSNRGIRTSIRTTSGRSRQVSSTTSTPSVATPTTRSPPPCPSLLTATWALRPPLSGSSRASTNGLGGAAQLSSWAEAMRSSPPRARSSRDVVARLVSKFVSIRVLTRQAALRSRLPTSRVRDVRFPAR